MVLKGTIFITDNINVIRETPIDNFHRIVSLDEDGALPDANNIIPGTCLLPPMEAKIAEADGDERKYDMIYSNYLLEPFQYEFVSALLSYLYIGGNLILFLPEIGYSNTRDKLIYFMYSLYGIHIGIVGNPNPQLGNCYYDDRCIPMWLNMIFLARTISPRDYLINYPVDAPITDQNVMNLLIEQLEPCGKTYNEKADNILRFKELLHKYPDVKQPFRSVI